MRKKTVFRRSREILSILIRYGFSEVLSRLKLKSKIKGIPVKAARENMEKPFAVRIRLALEELGPTFIKFGQMMSMRPDIFPQNIILELSRLQDQVPPFSASLVREIIESQFASPFSSVFKSFEESPDAAASIAQVHRAILFSGEEVAVKIQRPGIHDQVAIDLEVLAAFADLAERFLPEVAMFHPKDIIAEFSVNLLHELDFLREARNIESFHKYFAEDVEVFIPDIFREYCTEKILVMEYVHGVKISELDRLKSGGYDCKIIARRGIDAFFKQVFVNGFFHADPHSGNIFIMPGNIIAPVDFGVVGYVNDFMRQELGRALEAFVARDARRLVKVLRDLELVEDASITRELYGDIEHLITYYHHISLAQLKIGNVINDFIDIVRKHHVRIPTNFILLGKSVATIESIGKNLDPDFDISEAAKPYVNKILVSNLNPANRLKDLSMLFDDTQDLLRDMPDDIRTILKKMRTDKLKIKFEHSGLEHFIREMDKAGNRLSFSIIIAAFLIGSSFIINLNQGPLIFGIPVLGFLGYAAGGILGILLLIGIFRSGRL